MSGMRWFHDADDVQDFDHADGGDDCETAVYAEGLFMGNNRLVAKVC